MNPLHRTAPLRKRGAGATALTVGVCAVLALGLWVSFHYTLGAWRLDADLAVPLVLWEGVQRHGWGFLSTWAYTQDNWLLSLIPISSLLFAIVGSRPTLVVGMGWLIFVASVVMTGFLAARLSGRRAGLAVACVLLFASYSALGPVGYLAHPITHNISMAWALLALILALRGVERGEVVTCVAAGLCVFVAVVSDPWAAAAVGAPLVLVSGVIAAANWRTRQGRCAAVLCVTAAVGLWAARTQLFGLLWFLSKGHLDLAQTAAELVANMTWGFRALATMFNILPGATLDGAATAARRFDGLALAAVLGSAIVLTLLALRRASLGRQLVGGVAVLSIVGVIAAFLLGRWDPGANVGRFFPNLYFFGTLLVATVAAEGWRRWPWAAKAAITAYALLFIVSGLASQPRLWLAREPVQGGAEARALGDFLAGHGLTYGYGPYWGSSALMVGWMSDDRVVVRPVTLRSGRVRRRPAETSSLWYQPGDEPTNTPQRFLILRNDGEECPSVEACVGMATAQFGPASERLAFGDAVVLVWPRSISAKIDK
jgi:hypothetical protein